LFGFATTVDEVIAGVDLTGRTAVVTGASGGLGLQTCSALALAGAEVVALVRDPDAFQRSPQWTQLGLQGQGVRPVAVDLADLASVRAAATVIQQRYPAVDILVNNAGVMFTPNQTTVDGFELQFGVDHLGHFALTTQMLPQLLTAASSTGEARVVTVSSEAHREWGIDLSDINFERRGYDTFLAYGAAKSANILMTVELHRRYGASGIIALAVHPGTSATDLARYMSRETVKALFAMGADTFSPENMKSPAQAAATAVWAATAPGLSGHGGAYLVDCHVGAAAAAATDPGTAAQLWELSQSWVAAPPAQAAPVEANRR
jgi:NAD(P)-dependent dehydrogenase (short-subunit alcohol dehydrogenase family)